IQIPLEVLESTTKMAKCNCGVFEQSHKHRGVAYIALRRSRFWKFFLNLKRRGAT
ncbi:hypothetical protein TorRG33x02_269850, partial [Trema orientale]